MVTNTTLNPNINEVKCKIPSITDLATTAALNAKVKEVKGKIPSITDIATTTVLTVVENKMANISNLVKKTDYNRKISKNENKITIDHDHDKYITSQEFTARLAQANLGSKSDITNFVKKTF